MLSYKAVAAAVAAVAVLVALLAAGPAGAAPTSSPTPTSTSLFNGSCYVENGAVHARNLSSNIGCVGRSDILSDNVVPPGNGSIDFGALAESFEVALLIYSDNQCLIQEGFIVCNVLAPTICFIDDSGNVFVQNVYPDVQCITRVDVNDTLLTEGESNLEFDKVAESDDIRLDLFSDVDCTQTIQTEPAIFCRPVNVTGTPVPTATATPGVCPITSTFTVTAIIPQTVITRFVTVTVTSAQGCSLPSGPVCFEQDGQLHLRNLNEDVACVSRSDELGLDFFPVDGSVDFSQPPQENLTSISINLFTDTACSEQYGTLNCTQIAYYCATPTPTPFPTVTTLTTTTAKTTTTAGVANCSAVNSDKAVCFEWNGKLFLRNLPDYVGCVSRSDDPTHDAFPVDGAVSFGLAPQVPANQIQIGLFEDLTCSLEVGTLSCVQLSGVCPTPTPGYGIFTSTTIPVTVTAPITMTA